MSQKPPRNAQGPKAPKKVKQIPPDQEPLPLDLQAIVDAMTEREKIFADAYVHTLNKRKAALACGYAESTAGPIGSRMYMKPNVKAYIDYMINSFIGSPNENTKLLQTIRDTSINDYFVPVKRVKFDMIEVPLQKVIDGKKLELQLEEEYYLEYADSPQEETFCIKTIAALKREIGKLEIELRINPQAQRIIRGPEYLYDEMELDMRKIADDQEAGKIKTYRQTKDGIHVEMYSALDAANTLAKILGTDKSGQGTVVNVGATPEQLAKLTEEDLKTMAAIENKMRS